MTHARECVKKGVDRLQLSQLDLQAAIEPRPQECIVPLTADQKHFLKASIRMRMCASATRIIGPLNLGLLEKSIASLVRRHESLRTTFRAFDGVTTQHINPPDQYRLECVDLSTFSKSGAEREAQRLTRESQDKKIDLSIGPVFEAKLFRLTIQEHVLIVLVDHMISDEMSNALLDKEIWQAYDDALGDEPALLPTPPIQFADYVVWRERAKESWGKEHDDYWKRQRLAEGVPTTIPIASETNKCLEIGAVAHISFGSALTAQLRQFAERQHISLSNVTLMIYATAMSLWCDKEDLVVRCPVHGRHGRPELKNVIGFFSSYLCLRIKVNRQHTLQDLLVHIQAELRNAIAYHDFDRMQDFMPECVKTELEFHWRSARWRGRAEQKWPHSNKTIKRQPFLIRAPTWNLNFWCIFNEAPSDICVTVRYQPRLLRPKAVEQFGNDMRSIAKAFIDRPLDPIDRAVFSRGR